MKSVRASVDIGGTFTDVVLLGDDGTVLVTKIASTPDNYSEGVVDALSQAMRKLDIKPEEVTEVSHGFTVASNAILERRGGRTALITTEGFRDVLELARIRTPRLYDLYYRKPVPLVERRLRLEVKERVNFQGEVLSALEMADVERAAEFLSSEGIRSVAISLIHAYANPDHENRIASFLKNRIPDLSLSVSSSLLPEMGEYERTSTTVINAYVRPVVSSYLTELEQKVEKMGVRVPLTVMQSSGGLAPVALAAEKPMYCVESGPAAGVVAAFHLSRRLGLGDMITFDMGGTTAKASIIEDGEMLRAPEHEVGGGMNVGHRLLKGSGYILRVPTIDLAEVSAGGGSVAWIDKGGALQVGPQSAGAVPGPVCYDNGGSDPTVTDANVLLGYLNPDYLLGGDFRLNRSGAERALLDKVGLPLGMDATEAAYGVHRLVNSNMARAVSAVSQERGRDPRRFTLVAFGGGGPVHAAGLARTLGIERIIIPPSPGVFSAFGLLFADVEHHFSRSYLKEFSDLDLGRANQMLKDLVDQGRDLLLAEGFPQERQETVSQVDMKYVGQTSHLPVNLLQKEFDSTSLTQLGESFQQEHERTYGYRLDGPFQLCGLKIVARGISLESRVPESVHSIALGNISGPSQRQVFFGAPHEWVLTPVVSRSDLEGSPTDGPLVVEEYDSTILIPPGWRAALDSFNNITLEHVEPIRGVPMAGSQATDPVTREIIKNYLYSAADTMALTVVRTACSAVVKDGMDFSTAIFNESAEQVAQGLTLPFHVGAMKPALDAVIDTFEADVRPGDIFANNDPYEGASHLPDIFLFKPAFRAGTLVGWTCVIAHQTDIGGRVAGGNACDNTEIYQEGLRIPPIKLYEEGVLNSAVWRILGKNVRVPSKVLGDVLAQTSALRQGERDLLRLVEEYGLEELRHYMTEIIDHTERLTRVEIERLPDGEWEFTDYIDDDGITPDPIAIQVKVVIEGDEMLVDFSGTSPQAKGSINPNLAYTKSTVYAVVKCLTDPDINANSGFFRPITVQAPAGCFVNPQHPAAVAARGLGGFRIGHAVFGAMAKALPDRVPAAWGGGEIGVSFGGYFPDGKPFVFLEFNNDGPRGGGPYFDGADGAAAPITNMANTPIESIEAEQPLLIKRYGFVADTGGAGEYRGGLAMEREYELLADEATVQIRSDRTRFLPWGVQGGGPGTRTYSILNPSTENQILPSKFLKQLTRGDVYRLVQAGAGGYGDPLERDPEAVLSDVIQEKVSSEQAQVQYGVVIDSRTNELDLESTGKLRDRLRNEREPLTLEPRVIAAGDEEL